MKQQTLDQRISAALTAEAATVNDLQQLLQEVESSIERDSKLAQTERAKSTDLATSPSDADSAAQTADLAELRARRHRTGLPLLQEKLAAALQADAADKWFVEAAKVSARVEAAALALAQYMALAEQMISLITAAQSANEEISQLHGEVPDGVMHRLDRIDLRGFAALVLPDPARPGRNIYPVPQPSIAQLYAAGMGVPSHAGGNWWRTH